jgi:ATP-dependent DNA helicase RecQ
MQVLNPSVYRSNLHYRVLNATSEQEKLEQTLRLAHATAGPGIIYTATVKAAEEVHRTLTQAGENVTWYHGQMPSRMRAQSQETFTDGKRRIMVATNAFGMGIDKHDIRFVIHYQIPASLEAYYQESGRAGRDGGVAECTLLHDAKDKQVQQFFLARRYPGADDLAVIHAALRALAHEQLRVSYERLHAALAQVSETRLQVALKLLKDGGLLEQDQRLDYRLTRTRVKAKELAQLMSTYHDKSAREHEALERMVFYARTGFCRWKVLLDYFGEQVEWSHCGVCDNCLQPPEQALSPEHVRDHAPPSSTGKAPGVGSTVKVARYGQGWVVSTTADKVAIAFPDGATRTFLRGYVESVR